MNALLLAFVLCAPALPPKEPYIGMFFDWHGVPACVADVHPADEVEGRPARYQIDNRACTVTLAWLTKEQIMREVRIQSKR